MLSNFWVTGDEDPPITFYKSETPITPGTYFRLLGRISKEVKQKIAGISCSRGKEYLVLAPAEPWVQRLICGGIEPKQPILAPDPGWFVQQEIAFRDWQLQLQARVKHDLATKGNCRLGVIAGLGAGKTLAGLSIAQVADSPVVLAPRYLHGTWRAQAQQFGLQCPTLSTYESAYKIKQTDCLIVDEALALKSPEAARTQAAVELSRTADVVLGFTGTPTGAKGPMDWRWLRVIEPGCVPASEVPWRFLFGLDTSLEEVRPGQKAYVTTRWANDLVAKFVAPFTLSVDTKDLMEQLPGITFSTIKVPQPRDYGFILKGAATRTTVSKRVAQCRQCTDGFILNDSGVPVDLADSPKLDAAVEWVNGLGEPAILYAAWDHSIDLLVERLKDHKPSVLRGGGSPEKEIQSFLNGATDLLIANARFSQGMNLQHRCRIMGFLSVSSNPTDRTQALGRVQRPGQTRGVQIVDFLCESTLDERALDLVQNHNGLTAEQIEKLLEQEVMKTA